MVTSIKKLILIILLPVGFGFYPINSQAQLYVGPVLETQVTTAAFFNQSDKDGYRCNPGPGYRLGFTASKRVKNHFIFDVGLQYAHKQLNIKSVADPLLKIKNNFNYIEIPILYTLEFREHLGKKKAGISKDYEVFAGAGPVISYWLNSNGTIASSSLKEILINQLAYKAKFNYNEQDPASATDQNGMYVSDANRFQFALQLVGGVSFEPLGLQKIVVTGKVEIGQTRFTKQNAGYLPADFVEQIPLKSRPISFGINVAYLFNTKYEDSRKGKSTEKKRK